jgi:hypothetical protein
MVSLDKHGIEMLRIRIANVHHSIRNLLIYIDQLKLPKFLTRFNVYTILQGQPVPIGVLALLSDCLNFELEELICENAYIFTNETKKLIYKSHLELFEKALNTANGSKKKEFIFVC